MQFSSNTNSQENLLEQCFSSLSDLQSLFMFIKQYIVENLSLVRFKFSTLVISKGLFFSKITIFQINRSKSNFLDSYKNLLTTGTYNTKGSEILYYNICKSRIKYILHLRQNGFYRIGSMMYFFFELWQNNLNFFLKWHWCWHWWLLLISMILITKYVITFLL